MSAPAAPSFGDHLTALRRRRGPALVGACVVLVVALAGAMLWPATYRSTGTILIEQQEVPMDLVRSMVSSYADQRIQVISQRVMTSENLMRIIDRYELYAEDRRSLPREELIQRVRDDISFSMISADVVDPRLGRATKATIAFSVSYDSDSPVIAARVANELTTLYLNENLESRKQLADDAATFLTAEADRLAGQIAGIESELAQFKERNVARLPELTSLNLQLMSRAEEELRETETRIRALDQQIVFLEAQLVQLTPDAQIYTETGQRILSSSDRLKMAKSDYARATAVYAADHPDVLRLKREIGGLEKEVGRVASGNDLARQLREAQGQLASAREKYSADHPDVQQLERLVASIETMMRDAPLTAEPLRQEADNPAYIQVSSQREAAVSERESLQGKRATLRSRIADFEQRMAESPEIEREYSAMVRDLEGAQLKHREVRQKQMEAMLAKNLETERKGERFTLIEPPIVAEEPVSPNRPLLLLFGIVLALGSLVGTVALLEMLDRTVRGKRDALLLLPVPPLAVLPWIENSTERLARTRVRRFSMAGAASAVVAAVLLTHFLYRPLDVLWEIALRRLTG